jgi:hypothetical protein
MSVFEPIVEAMESGDINSVESRMVIYRDSFTELDSVKLLMVRCDGERYILATGRGRMYDDLSGEPGVDYKICALNHHNRIILNRYLIFTVPVALGNNVASIGLGDRLGIASPGYIRAIKGREVKPVLAQQSVAELKLIGRNFRDVLDTTCFAVFQEGYRTGYGADGDHLKTEVEVTLALSFGFSMITLDCSNKIDNTLAGMRLGEIKKRYGELPDDIKKRFEENYLNRPFKIGGAYIRYDENNLIEDVLKYYRVIEYTAYIYNNYIEKAGREIDFEITIDEATFSTTTSAHYLIAHEIQQRGVKIESLALRFCDNFHKGIDYRGDLTAFEKDLRVHAAIADHFGYRLSFHSGSDKFSIYPSIKKFTKGRFHIKTAGTSWLEAVRIIALRNPALYRKMHRYVLKNFEESREYYNVNIDLGAITPLERAKEEELIHYLDDDNARQLLHIAYGMLLQARDESGVSLFKDEFFTTLIAYQEDYETVLMNAIRRHLDMLGR